MKNSKRLSVDYHFFQLASISSRYYAVKSGGREISMVVLEAFINEEALMKNKIHIFGASGSGTTTIAKNICEQINYKHFDSDNYLWLPTEEPFTVMRPKEEYLSLMGDDLNNNEKWILSGHVSFGFVDVYLSLYDLIVFVYVPMDIRIERLKKRECERYGEEILPGNKRFEKYNDFIEYALSYDTASGGRSLEKHEKWLNGVDCPVLRIINNSLDDSINAVLEAIG